MIIKEIEVGKIYYTYPWALVELDRNGEILQDGHPKRYICVRFSCFESPYGNAKMAVKKVDQQNMIYDHTLCKDELYENVNDSYDCFYEVGGDGPNSKLIKGNSPVRDIQTKTWARYPAYEGKLI